MAKSRKYQRSWRKSARKTNTRKRKQRGGGKDEKLALIALDEKLALIALIEAAREGDAAKVRTLLLANPTHVNQAGSDGNTALHMAALYGHTAVAKLLLANPAIDVNQEDWGGVTALFWAEFYGHTAVAELLRAHPGIKAKKGHTDAAVPQADKYGRTPMYEAAHAQWPVAEVLLEAYPAIDVTMRGRRTPGHTAVAAENGHTAVAEKGHTDAAVPPALINYFLIVIHGTTTTPHKRYWEIRTKFTSINMFESHGNLLYEHIPNLGNLSEIMGNPELMYNVATDAHKETFKPNDQGFFTLPPLVFAVNDTDNERFKDLMGIYHFSLDRNKNTCTLVDKIVNWTDLQQKYGSGYIAYSILFQYITKYLNKNKNDWYKQYDSELGIFSCRGVSDETRQKYLSSNDLMSNEPQSNWSHYQLASQNQLDKYTPYDNSKREGYASLLLMNNTPDKKWSGALLGMKYQGCALNVLSYFGILYEKYASEMTACLPIQGTSIFKIVDIINNFLSLQDPPIKRVFMIMRFYKSIALTYLYTLFESPRSMNTFTIFKLYTDRMHNDKDSEIGHTISISRDSTGVFMLDPQAGKYINNKEEFEKYIERYKYIDLIFIYDENQSDPQRPWYATEALTKTGEIRERPVDLFFGGKKNNKSKRNKSKRNKSKRN